MTRPVMDEGVVRALHADDWIVAAERAEAAIARGDTHPMLFTVAAIERQRVGDLVGAVALGFRAAEIAPYDSHVLATVGDLLRQAGELRAALTMFDRALAENPALAAACYGKALALEASGATKDAIAAYRRTIEVSPDTPGGYAGLASLQAVLGDIAAARTSAARALSLAPQDAGAALALARCDLADGRPMDSVGRIERLVAGGTSDTDAVLAFTLLGDAHDKAGNPDAAFVAYEAANARFTAMHGRSTAPGAATDELLRLAKGLASFQPPAPAAGGTVPRTHIFLLGYPRSGTTLVEQLLASRPDVRTIEEEPTLADAAKSHLLGGNLQRLARLDRPEAEMLRAAYWERVAETGIDPRNVTFVDMDPFKGPALPLIGPLFPSARVLVVRRDPRDVVWSCFRRTFAPSPASLEFIALDRAARHYDATMRLVELALPSHSGPVHILRYEDLVSDFDTTARALCDFAELPWSADIRNFAAQARRRAVKTVSAPQVRSGLFDGRGQWRPYARHIEPLAPLLGPWVERFGYRWDE